MAEIKETVIIEAKVNGEDEVSKLGKAINKSKEATEKQTQATNELSGSLDKATGGAITGFKGVLSSVKNTTTAFRTLKGAIIATGIGALLIVITSLIAAFKGSEEGQNRWNKIMAVTGAIIGNLVDLMADFGDAIIKAVTNPRQAWESLTNSLKSGWDFIRVAVINPFVAGFQNLGLKFEANIKQMRIAWNEFTGDSEEAEQLTLELEKVNAKILENEKTIKKGAMAIVSFYDEAKEAVQGFIEEQINEGNAAAGVADMRAKADKIERDLLIERAKLENEIAQLRLKSRQEEEFSATERRQALIDAQELEETLLKKEKEALQLRADAQSLENTFARSNKQNLDDEARLKAAVIQQEAKRTNAARSTQRELNRINKEIQRDNEAIRKEEEKQIQDFEKFKIDLAQKEKERKAQTDLEKLELEQETKEKELENLKITETQKQEALLEIERIFGERRTELIKKQKTKQAEEEAKIIEQQEKVKEAELQAQKNRDKEGQQILTEGLGALANSVGLGKEFAIAKTLFDTFQSSRAAFSSQLIPGDPTSLPRAIGAAALSAVSGLADVAAIKAVKTPNVAGSGGGASGQSATAPQPPAFNLVGQANTSAITQPITQTEERPVQAFVVSRNVTTAQQADRNAESASTF